MELSCPVVVVGQAPLEENEDEDGKEKLQKGEKGLEGVVQEEEGE